MSDITYDQLDKASAAIGLLPCPFCGGPAHVDRARLVNYHHAVKCDNCHIEMEGYSWTRGNAGQLEAVRDAARKWNQRASIDEATP